MHNRYLNILHTTLIYLCLFQYSTYAQSKPDKVILGTSVYFAPYSLMHTYVGRSLRFGIEQKLNNRLSTIIEGSHYLPKGTLIRNLQGYKAEAGFRFYYKNAREDNVWFGLTAGMVYQKFNQDGNFYFPNDTISLTATLTRKAQFFHLEIGHKFILKYKFYADIGAQIGARHRDIDIQGFSESDDNYYRTYRSSSAHTQLSFKTKDMYIPDFNFLLRIGYKLF